MNPRLISSLIVVLALGGAGYFFIARDSHARLDAQGEAHAEAEPEMVRGPHRGRLLTAGDFTVELAIFEEDVPPEFRAWFTQGGKSIAPADVRLSVQLTRPGNRVDTFKFAPQGDFARGDLEVEEPHSFDYVIVAEHGGRTHRWAFAAPEMQTTIPAADAGRAGVKVAAASPVTLAERLTVYGTVKLNGDKIARVVPRFSGIIREARKSLGDSVTAGEVVAVVETNLTLALLEVKAPIGGIIVDRNVTAGETVIDGAALYTIADLSEVWIDLNIPKRAQAKVKVGLPVLIQPDDGGPEVAGTIAWISPLSSAEAQTLVARVIMSNPEGRWRPGLFLKAEITLEKRDVALAIRDSGLQTIFDFTVVFSQHGDLYQARPLELGQRSDGYVEVLKGLRPGENYVMENSFLIKADILKSGATHDH